MDAQVRKGIAGEEVLHSCLGTGQGEARMRTAHVFAVNVVPDGSVVVHGEWRWWYDENEAAVHASFMIGGLYYYE